MTGIKSTYVFSLARYIKHYIQKRTPQPHEAFPFSYKISNILFLHLRPIPSHPVQHIIQNPRDPARKDPVQDHRAGDGEDFAADAEDLALLLVLDGRGHHGVGEASDGHQGPGPAEGDDFREYI